MAMAYGTDWNRGGEHYTSANQKAAWAQQAAAGQQQQAASWERGREMYERGLQGQEQQRRQYDSETARQMGAKKYDVLSGLLGGKMGGGSPSFSWPYGSMYGGSGASGSGRMRGRS